jgi:hypothetical protein
MKKTEKQILLCNVSIRILGALGAAGCFVEGHPYISTGLLAAAGGVMEVKDYLTKKQNPPFKEG